MKDIKIVCGSNWGDEGKGLMTDYFSQKPKVNHLQVLTTSLKILNDYQNMKTICLMVS